MDPFDLRLHVAELPPALEGFAPAAAPNKKVRTVIYCQKVRAAKAAKRMMHGDRPNRFVGVVGRCESALRMSLIFSFDDTSMQSQVPYVTYKVEQRETKTQYYPAA